MIRKFTIILLFILVTSSLFAQIGVKSFRKLENDMSARVDAKKLDQNGDVCAIIKVVTTQTGFSFDCGQLGIVATIQKPSEIWVYVPYGAKRITISHAQLGILRDYMFPSPVEKACVYELVLISGRVETTVIEEINSQWLVIAPDPSDAMIYIDDLFVKSGAYQAKHKPGSYTYRVEAPLYHSEAGRVDIADAKKELNVKLKPAFGYLTINSKPEQGAKIIIDGKEQSQLTPFKSERLASGEYTVQVVKEMYQPFVKKVIVADGQTTPVDFTMSPNFAEISITAPADAIILINNLQKGTGTYSSRLNPGIYSLEATLISHRPAKQDIEVLAGETKTINLQPTPIYGSLDVVTTPPGVNISINGKDYGTTPNTINNLLIGNYLVQLTKDGYAAVSKNVDITDGKSIVIEESLANGRSVSISSTPVGANLYIDNNLMGQTPFTGSLTFGSHNLRIEHDGKKGEKTISISQSDGGNSFVLSLGISSFTEIVNGVNFDMIAVKGGTFLMGSNDGESRENPVHSVTVSDFYIGKTEVTQALWVAVMGSNPSKFKGDNFPVESVSWDNVQDFIKKLNQLTGKHYRLSTEAEWEYAAGGGSTNRTKWAGTNTESNLGDYAWYALNSNGKAHHVATKLPNALGLYDMSGNVWEWCSDRYRTYPSRAQTNPQGPSSGSHRVIRGSSFYQTAQLCRSAFRNGGKPSISDFDAGFRLVYSK